MAFMPLDEAILKLRNDPQHASLVRDAYLGPDVIDSAERFLASGEFLEVKRVLGDRIRGAAVVDLGAGTGIASYAFAKSGAARVWAIEPDLSGEVGRGALARLAGGLPIEAVDSFGENLALPDACADIVYVRQVLHHAHDLNEVLRQCYRALKPGGLFIACREHVANTPEDLARFLQNHPVHQLAGGEHAFALTQYLSAIRGAGLQLTAHYTPLDSVINMFPEIRTQDELTSLPRRRLERRFGALGGMLAMLPFVRARIRRTLDAALPAGAMHTFVAAKP